MNPAPGGGPTSSGRTVPQSDPGHAIFDTPTNSSGSPRPSEGVSPCQPLGFDIDGAPWLARPPAVLRSLQQPAGVFFHDATPAGSSACCHRREPTFADSPAGGR